MSDAKERLRGASDDVFVPSDPAVEARQSADVLTEGERRFEILRREQIIREKDQELEQHREEHGLRKRYLLSVFVFVQLFVFCVMAILVLCATSVLVLGERVQMVLLGTTTIDLVGLLYIAFKWLFPNRQNQ